MNAAIAPTIEPVAAPVAGYRYLGICVDAHDRRQLFFTGVNNGGAYGVDATASCNAGGSHPAPAWDCTCGFHICSDISTLDQVIAGTSVAHRQALCRASVEVSGRVVEHEHGARGQHQHIRGIEVSPCACGSPAAGFVIADDQWLTPVCGNHDIVRWTLADIETHFGVPATAAHQPFNVRRSQLSSSGEPELTRIQRAVFAALAALLGAFLVWAGRVGAHKHFGSSTIETAADGTLIAVASTTPTFSIITGALVVSLIAVAGAGAAGLSSKRHAISSAAITVVVLSAAFTAGVITGVRTAGNFDAEIGLSEHLAADGWQWESTRSNDDGSEQILYHHNTDGTCAFEVAAGTGSLDDRRIVTRGDCIKPGS